MVIEKAQGVIVTGAKSQIGHYLLPKLVDAGYRIFAVTRKGYGEASEKSSSVSQLKLDIAKKGFEEHKDIAATSYIHIASLTLLPPIIESLATLGIARIIAFGSTSRYTKANSPSLAERAVAEALIDSEEKLAIKCGQHGINWTIFRPTLIYGCGIDKNVSTIANIIKRFEMFPIVGEGKGKREPVHADDLAEACILSLGLPATYNRAYNLSGGESLTYGEMVDRIFDGLGKKRRKIKIPLPLFRAALKAISYLPKYNYLTEGMADRMNEDLSFDHADAANDFGFSPRGFSFETYIYK